MMNDKKNRGCDYPKYDWPEYDLEHVHCMKETLLATGRDFIRQRTTHGTARLADE